jgi:hypothetical protein
MLEFASSALLFVLALLRDIRHAVMAKGRMSHPTRRAETIVWASPGFRVRACSAHTRDSRAGRSTLFVDVRGSASTITSASGTM